ncbi:MAG: hypothetical protein Q7N87_01485 [Candidatus Uhrbacteria bacterium]|nr:hypothetical protein [Candidatus Uhrbacteria bacterium]
MNAPAEQLRTRFVDEVKMRLQKMVTNGKITKEEAHKRLQRIVTKNFHGSF